MKKNIRNVPESILEKLKTINSKEIVAGCAVKFKSEFLLSGKLKHLGIELTPEGLKVPYTVVSNAKQGKYSEKNIHGKEIVRKDLPKETHYNVIESPNWGDAFNGTHTVYLPYKKYPREFEPPRELEISMICKDARPNLPIYVIAFQIKEVLDKGEKDFKKKLLEDLNLLQENIGACGVEPADMKIAEYGKTLHLSWEILPPGTLDETLGRIFKGKAPSAEEKKVTAERYAFFQTLKPKSLVFGNSGLRRYFGALLEDNLVVFENIEYGNAIYILFDNWEELSKRSRLELVSGKYGKDFERVVHTTGWKDAVKNVIQAKRRGRK
jgi:hypothetical protein